MGGCAFGALEMRHYPMPLYKAEKDFFLILLNLRSYTPMIA